MTYCDVDVNEPLTQIPTGTRPLFHTFMRDPNVCIGHDGAYYLTGTTRPEDGRTSEAWVWNDGVRLWRSEDLAQRRRLCEPFRMHP